VLDAVRRGWGGGGREGGTAWAARRSRVRARPPRPGPRPASSGGGLASVAARAGRRPQIACRRGGREPEAEANRDAAAGRRTGRRRAPLLRPRLHISRMHHPTRRRPRDAHPRPAGGGRRQAKEPAEPPHAPARAQRSNAHLNGAGGEGHGARGGGRREGCSRSGVGGQRARGGGLHRLALPTTTKRGANIITREQGGRPLNTHAQHTSLSAPPPPRARPPRRRRLQLPRRSPATACRRAPRPGAAAGPEE